MRFLHHIFYALSLAVAVMLPRDSYADVAVNYDALTTGAISGTFIQGVYAEQLGLESLEKVFKSYEHAAVAVAGIYEMKRMEYKALRLPELFSSQEFMYYKMSYEMVRYNIVPRLWRLIKLLVYYPDRVIYWGPYLYEVLETIKNLCIMFESVVTNGTLSFSDIFGSEFPSFKEDVMDLLSIKELAGYDWEELVHQLLNIDPELVLDDVQNGYQDLRASAKDIWRLGKAVASSGADGLDSIAFGNTNIGQIFRNKPKQMFKKMGEVGNKINETYSSVKSNYDQLMGAVDSIKENDIYKLFNEGGVSYDMSDFVSDYKKKESMQFYRQRYCIAPKETPGSEETLCNFVPDVNNSEECLSLRESLRGYHGLWYINYADLDYYNYNYYTDFVIDDNWETAKAIAEASCGWSQVRVDQLNARAAKGEKYTITYHKHLEVEYCPQYNGDESHYKNIYLCWDIKVVHTIPGLSPDCVYEVWYDSYDMNYDAFQTTLLSRLNDFQADHEGVEYEIRTGDKQYYSLTEEKQMMGCYNAIFRVICEDNNELYAGSHIFKVTPYHHPLDDSSKEYAMATTLPDGPNDDLDKYNESCEEHRTQIANLSKDIDALTIEINELYKRLAVVMGPSADVIQEQIDEKKAQKQALTERRAALQKELDELDSRRQEIEEEYRDEQDEYRGIPGMMHECENLFGLEWLDDGMWVGYNFIRTAHMSSANATVTFKATLTAVKDEDWFLSLFRYHRSKIQIEFWLTSSSNSSNFEEYVKLDPNKTDRERSQEVNRLYREYQANYPDCQVEYELVHSDPLEKEADDNTIHLLWASDRLRIAREVYRRLDHINNELFLMEAHFVHIKTIKSLLGNPMAVIINGSRRSRVTSEALRKFRDDAKRAVEEKLSD